MATFDPNIFRAYDVRGIWGQDFDAEFAQRLGSRVASHLKAGTIVIGRDSRVSSDEITYAVIDGALHTGATVIDVGQVSSPQFYWAIRTLGAAGGIMVTASHNPPAYNGFKVIGEDVEVLGGHRIRQIFDSHPHTHRTDGTVRFKDIIPEYAAAIAEAAAWSGEELQMSIDGPAAVRRALECIAPIAPDHGLAAKFDPDGDRIAFFVDGKPIAPDWMFLLLTEELRLEPVVMDLRFSLAARERLERYHVKYTVSKVGRLYMVENMRKTDAMFGAEMSGHYYFKQFGGMEAPELVLLQVAGIVAKHGKDLGTLVKQYIQYHKSPEISIPVADRKAVDRALARVKKTFGDDDIDELDGITVRRRDWWFNVRPSNTEPVLRIVVEAKEKDLLDEKVRTLTGLLNRSD